MTLSKSFPSLSLSCLIKTAGPYPGCLPPSCSQCPPSHPPVAMPGNYARKLCLFQLELPQALAGLRACMPTSHQVVVRGLGQHPPARLCQVKGGGGLTRTYTTIITQTRNLPTTHATTEEDSKAGESLPSPVLSGLCDHIITLDSILFNCSLLSSNQPIISHNYSLIRGHNSYFIVC